MTLNGSDPLLSEVENCSDMIDMPNDLEVNHAFTPKMSNMLTVVSFTRAHAHSLEKMPS